MKLSTLMATPATGLSAYVLSTHSAHTAPNAFVQGTALSFAGSAAQVAVLGARVLDLPGSPPRGAPV